MRQTGKRMLLLVALLLTAGAINTARAQPEGDWSPRKFLETVKYIADNVDLEDEETLTRLLRIELENKERPLPEKDMMLKSQEADYLTDVKYGVSRPIEQEGGRKRAYIWLTLKHEQFCVQLDDALAVLGEEYEVPRPTVRDYWTKDGAVDGEAIARELRERDGKFDSIAYRRFAIGNGISIRFEFRRCARHVWISRTPPISK